MRADLAARLLRSLRGEAIAETGVTGVSGVTASPRLRPKPQQLRQLRPLRLENEGCQKSAENGVTEPVTAPIKDDVDAIEERAAMAAGSVAAVYLDAWARLQCQRPMTVEEADWRLAIDDAGRFLDAWGAEAAAMQWRAGELFDVPREGEPGGLFWQLKGSRVEALGADHARLSDGGVISHGENKVGDGN